MLEIGTHRPLHIRHERVANTGSALRLLYVSDTHLSRRTDHVIDQVVKAAQSCQPELILLGGDLVDRTAGLTSLRKLVTLLSAFCPVWAVPGNHDDHAGRARVQAVVEAVGGVWLAGKTRQWGGIQISGDRTIAPYPASFSILCAHYPADVEQAARLGYNLVLAGHLHGSQIHLVYRKGRSYPGAWLYRWNGERFQCGKTLLLVSRGVNDTLPLRWNCPREVILCEIN